MHRSLANGSARSRAMVAALTVAAVASPAVGAASPGPNPTGGSLSMAITSDIPWLDPAIGYDQYSAIISRLIFETLVTYDAGTGLVPRLAEAMPGISDDGLVYTIHLRAGVPFVGRDGNVIREATADDVVYSLNRLLDPSLTPAPSPVGDAFYSIIAGSDAVLAGGGGIASGLRALDERTVQITLQRAYRPFLNILAMPFASVVPSEFAGQDTQAFSQDPVGTGPFLLKSFASGQEAVFIRNPHYWQAGLPYLDQVVIQMGVDRETQVQRVEAGQLDIMGDAIPRGSYAATIEDPALQDYLQRLTLVETDGLSINTGLGPDSPLSNVLVRRAIAHAIDRDNLRRLGNNRHVPATCIFPPDLPGFDPACEPYAYDPDAARALLAQAGYPDGFATTFYTLDDGGAQASAQAIQQDLGAVGIGLEIVTQDFSTWLGTVGTPGAAPMSPLGWAMDFPDPSDFIDPILSCASAVAGGTNSAFYCKPEVDALADQARAESDPAVYIPLYQEIQRRIMADAAWIPYQHQQLVFLVSPRLIGFAPHPVWIQDLPFLAVQG